MTQYVTKQKQCLDPWYCRESWSNVAYVVYIALALQFWQH